MRKEAERIAHEICRDGERLMRAMGVVTTAHYETMAPLIAKAIVDAYDVGFWDGRESGSEE